MKVFIYACVLAAIIAMMLLITSTSYAAEKNWSIVVKDSKSSEEVRTNDECVELNINKGKTILKVCACGSVEVQEYKEVVKNKDNTFSPGVLYYNGNVLR